MRRGDQGEELAVSHLLGLGYRIEERNWRDGRNGEIDIIAYDGEVLVFVEVKDRGRGALEKPMQAVTASKRRRISGLAERYLYRRELYGKVDCRFDVIGIESGQEGRSVEHVKDAFRA